MMKAVTAKRFSVLFAMLTVGCAWQPGGGSKAIESGVSPSGSSEAVWFATERPGLSAIAKDFLFVGPMSVNRNGERRQYLWFGIATTIDRRLTGAGTFDASAVVVNVDGTPMTFDLVPWSSDPEQTPYDPGIDSFQSFAARVTGSQLRQLSGAREITAFVVDGNGRSPLYEVVNGDRRSWTSSGASTFIPRN